MAKKVPSAGMSFGKGVPGKPFPPSGAKTPTTGKIGGTGNRFGAAKSYGKGK